jgi:hypothetical protein
VADSCEHGNELSGSIRRREIFWLAECSVSFPRRILFHEVTCLSIAKCWDIHLHFIGLRDAVLVLILLKKGRF